MQHKRPMLKTRIQILQGHTKEDLRRKGAAAVFRAACSMLPNSTHQTSKTTPKVANPTSKSGNASSVSKVRKNLSRATQNASSRLRRYGLVGSRRGVKNIFVDGI